MTSTGSRPTERPGTFQGRSNCLSGRMRIQIPYGVVSEGHEVVVDELLGTAGIDDVNRSESDGALPLCVLAQMQLPQWTNARADSVRRGAGMRQWSPSALRQ